ncbi:hypothetical protein [Bacillus cereus]|uniref:hypothetical protein n=1 Tax=Bacillus cereus TaxID=1396 RepID=UPI0002F37382|nr:hypothetical protein [Bacillus cereus]
MKSVTLAPTTFVVTGETLKASSLKFTNKLELYINQLVDISKIKCSTYIKSV